MAITIPANYGTALVPTLPADSSDAAILRQVGDQLHAQGGRHDLTGVLHTRPGRSSRSLLLLGHENDCLRRDPATLLTHLGWRSEQVVDHDAPAEWPDEIIDLDDPADYLNLYMQPRVSSTVHWDVGRSTTLLEPETAESREFSERVWPAGQSVTVELLALIRDDRDSEHEVDLWAVSVNNQLSGMTSDPMIIDRVRRGEVTNLDDLALDLEVVHIPVLTV